MKAIYCFLNRHHLSNTWDILLVLFNNHQNQYHFVILIFQGSFLFRR